MQIILRTDVENLGKLGEVVNVKPGYARNYLIPKNLAMLASDSNKRVFEQQRRKLQERLDQARFKAQDLAQQLEEISLQIPVRVGENDKLYGSVTNATISEALAEKGYDIDKKKVELDKPIRALGEYKIGVKVYPEVRSEINVAVVRYGEEDGQGKDQE